MYESTVTILERIAELLNEALMHPGVHSYMKGHQVVYHGTVGRFRVYSAHKTGAPSKKVIDVSQLPRHKPDAATHVWGDGHWNKPGMFIKHFPADPDEDHVKKPLAFPYDTHHVGAMAFSAAHDANAELDRLGAPNHKTTLVVTDAPTDTERTHQLNHATGKLKFGRAKKTRAWGQNIGGHQHSTMHHIALNSLNAKYDSPSGLAGTIAHEWAHHQQTQLSKEEKSRLSDAFNRSVEDPETRARTYGHKNWREWHSTSIEAAVARKQRLAGYTKQGTVSGDLVKAMIEPHTAHVRKIDPVKADPRLVNYGWARRPAG
jgi:hypothetical protein